MVKQRNCIILNNMAEGGPWTWVQRGKEHIKICLHLAICSQNLHPFVKIVRIDENREFTPLRVIWRNNKFTSIFTDHRPVEVVLCGMPRRNVKVDKSCEWNLSKPGGWKVFRDLTNKAADAIEEIVTNEELDIDTVVKKLDVIDNQVKFTVFGKRRIRQNKRIKVVAEDKQSDEELIKKQSKKIEDEILKISSKNYDTVAVIRNGKLHLIINTQKVENI